MNGLNDMLKHRITAKKYHIFHIIICLYFIKNRAMIVPSITAIAISMNELDAGTSGLSILNGNSWNIVVPVSAVFFVSTYLVITPSPTICDTKKNSTNNRVILIECFMFIGL